MRELPIYSAEDRMLEGMVMAIIQPINSQGDFKLRESGRGFVPSATGISIVVEDKYLMQLEKFRLEMDAAFQPRLILKDGETFEEPYESYTTARERELRNELYKLQQQKQREEEGMVPLLDEME